MLKRPLLAVDASAHMREQSILCHLAALLYRLLLFIVTAIYMAFESVWPFSYIAKFLDFLTKLRLSDLCAGLIAVMLCVDDSRWNNGYMLIVALFVAALYILQQARGRRERAEKLPVSLYLFIGISALAIFMGAFVAEAMRVYTYFVSAFCFMFCLAGSVRDFRDFRRVFMILYVAVWFTSAFSLFQFAGGIAVNTSYTDVANNSGMPGRVFATFSNPNNFAEILLLLIPCSFISFMAEPRISKGGKIILAASFVLPIVALLLTYARASWASFAIIVATFIGLYNLKLVPVFALLAAMAIPFLPTTIVNRVLSLFTGNDTSMGYRVWIWEGVYEYLKTEPVNGSGLGTFNFYNAYRKFMLESASVASHGHNLFLELWLETGLFGMLSFVSFYLATLKNTLSAAFRSEKGFRYGAIAMFSTLLGMIFVEMVEYVWFYPRVMLIFWSVLGLAWALVRIIRSAGKENFQDKKFSGDIDSESGL